MTIGLFTDNDQENLKRLLEMEEKHNEKVVEVGEGIREQLARLADVKALDVEQKSAIANSLNNIAEAINKLADAVNNNK